MRQVVVFALLAACGSESKPAANEEAPVREAKPAPGPARDTTEPVASAGPAAPDPAIAKQLAEDQTKAARKQALDQARAAGILGNAKLAQGGAFATLQGQGTISSGFDDADIMGGLVGNPDGEKQGGFGFGRSGFGPGGGGTGGIGIGRYGTLGHGSGTGAGYGIGGGGMRGRTSCVPRISIGAATVAGELDAAIVRRYIKRNIQKLQYCYEKELLASPGIQGTVATKFTISEVGTVTAADASGVHANVSSCVRGVIETIEFPKPKSGTVAVQYPFKYTPCAP